QRAAVDDLELGADSRSDRWSALPVVPGLLEQALQRPEHERQRRPEFMADVAEERALRAVELGEGLGPALFVFVAAGVVDRGADGVPEHGEKIAVTLVERQPRARAHHQPPRRGLVSGG